MENQSAALLAAAGDAWDAVRALVLAYSFSVVGAVIILIAGFILAGVAQRWAYTGLGHVRGFDETLRRFLSGALRYAILIMVGVSVLAQFGVQTASILAALGAAGLAIGLALQGTLQNIAAGIMLLVLKPFRVGEYIETGNVAGTIQEIGLFATELRAPDGIYILAPNSQLWNTPVRNHSRNANRRAEILVGIEGQDKADAALDALVDLVVSDARVRDSPAPQAFVVDLVGGNANLALRFWSSSPQSPNVKRELTAKVRDALEQRGVKVLSVK